MKRIVSVCLLVSVSACAGAVPWNKQNYAGISQWKVKSCETDNSRCVEGVFIDGKESEEKQLAIQLADGTIIKYSTAGERAFEAFKTRADVEKFVANQFGEVIPGVVDAIVKSSGISP